MSGKKSILVPWVEKFRPKTLKDVVSQDVLVASLDKYLQQGNLPHLLFYGPPGTGKTSVILALAHDMFGPEMYKQRVMELNASDERGINTIREKVKKFAQQSIATKPAGYPYPCPAFKIIILDEADSLTSDAQSALRRVMEVFTRITRFCLICNYVSKIVDPIASRCAKFRFAPLMTEAASQRLKDICKQENVVCGDEELALINNVAKGDLRKAITLLHSSSRLYRNDITKDAIFDMAGFVPEKYTNMFLEAFQSGSFDALYDVIERVRQEGFSAYQLIEQVLEELIKHPGLNDEEKAMIGFQTAQTEKMLLDGASEELQLKALFSFITRIFFKHVKV